MQGVDCDPCYQSGAQGGAQKHCHFSIQSGLLQSRPDSPKKYKQERGKNRHEHPGFPCGSARCSLRTLMSQACKNSIFEIRAFGKALKGALETLIGCTQFLKEPRTFRTRRQVIEQRLKTGSIAAGPPGVYLRFVQFATHDRFTSSLLPACAAR